MLLGAALVVALLAALGIVKISAVLDPGPGEPGWQPFTGEDVRDEMGSPNSFRTDQLIRNRTDQPIVVESVRVDAPKGFTRTKYGILPPNQYLYLFGTPELIPLPFRFEARAKHRLYAEYRIDCLPSGPPASWPVRVFLTVRMGALHQEVELRDAQPMDDNGTGPEPPACP